MSKLPTKDDGFSLLELLVAIAILSIAVIPMLTTQSSALKNTADLNDRALAQIVAENALTELRLSEVTPVAGIMFGNEKQANVSFDWQADIRNLPGQPLTTIFISVSKSGGSGSIYQITGFREKS